MIKTDKREKFMNTLSFSKTMRVKPLELNRKNIEDKSLETSKLFNGLKKKYTLGSKRNVEYVKMEFKKFYE